MELEEPCLVNAPPDSGEVYVGVYDLLAKLLKETPEYASLRMPMARPIPRMNALFVRMDIDLTCADSKPLLYVNLDITSPEAPVPTDYLALHIAEGQTEQQKKGLVRFQKLQVPLYHYGDLSFGIRFAACLIAESALLAMQDEDMFTGVLVKRAFDRTQDRLQALYAKSNFSFYPQSVTAKKAS
jgi:hypothetical protein